MPEDKEEPHVDVGGEVDLDAEGSARHDPVQKQPTDSVQEELNIVMIASNEGNTAAEFDRM